MAENHLRNSGRVLTDNDVTRQIEDLKRESQKIREDFLIIFGLLAAVIAFLTAEVQAFKDLTSFSSLVGFSAFLLSAILAFVVGLQVVVRDEKGVSRYWPTIVLVLVFLFISLASFYWSAHHYLFFLK